MRDEIERRLLAVSGQKPPRPQRQRPLRHLEHVLADDPPDGEAHPRRIAEPGQRGRDEVCADLLVRELAERGMRVEVQPAVLAAPRRGRLARVVEERGQPDAQRRAVVGGGLDDGEEMLVERQLVVAALLVEADRGLELGQDLDESVGVAGEPERSRRLRPEQQLRELAEPVAREAAADPLSGDVGEPGRPFAHLPLGLRVEVEAELGDEAEPPHDPERVVAEARGARRPQHPPRQVAAAVERIEELPVRRRFAIALTVKSRRAMSCAREIEASASISKSCRPGPVERSTRGGANSIPDGCRARAARSRGSSRTPIRWSATTRSSTRPCGSSAARSSEWPTPGTTKSISRTGSPSSSFRTAPPTT